MAFASQPQAQQKEEGQPASSSSPRESAPFIHDPDASTEIMRQNLPNASNIVLDYLDGDIDTASCSIDQIMHLTLFGKHAAEFVAPKVAMLILQGEEKNIDEAVAIVKQNPYILHCVVTATDRLVRAVRGTPLQIALMAGDVNLRDNLTEERLFGAAERLIAAAGLSRDEVARQLGVINSPEAAAVNAARNQRIQEAVVAFGNNICDTEADSDMSLEAFQARCQPVLAQFKRDLAAHPEGPITSGYVFDLANLAMAAEWFEQNIERFGGWWSLQSDVFCVNGFGTLQSMLSSRDAQVAQCGIGYYQAGSIPTRRALANPDGTSYFGADTRLGAGFYIGSFGGACRGYRAGGQRLWTGTIALGWEESLVENLMSRKNSSIGKLMQPADPTRPTQSGNNHFLALSNKILLKY